MKYNKLFEISLKKISLFYQFGIYEDFNNRSKNNIKNNTKNKHQNSLLYYKINKKQNQLNSIYNNWFF